MDSDYISLAGQVADGEFDGFAIGDSLDRVETNLYRIASLSAMFRTFANAQPAPEPMEGRVWGPLLCREMLGEGRFGRVYRAYEPTLQREVALKVRRGPSTGDFDYARFIDEARRLARVRHPNVLAVHGAAEFDGQAGLWSDLIDGITLEAALDEGRRFSSSEIVDIFEALASALCAVHEAGLLHGDVKASNVMIERTGRIVLMDFGAGQQSADRRPARYGSPLVMAPELFLGEPSTPAADCYALGVLLFRLLYGSYPVPGQSFEEVAALHRQSHPVVAEHSISDKVPRLMRRTVRRLLSRNPEVRPGPAECMDIIRRIRAAPLRKWRVTGVVALVAVLVSSLAALAYVIDAKQEVDRTLAREHAVNRILRDMLTSPQRGRDGPRFTLTELLERQRGNLETALLDQPLARADLLALLGITYGTLEQDETSSELLREALQLLEASGGDAEDVLTVGRFLVLALSRGNADQAIALGQEMVTRGTAVETTLPIQIGLRHALVFALSVAGRSRDALPVIEEADAMLPAIEWDDDTHIKIEYLNIKAQALVDLGEFATARKTIESVLADAAISDLVADRIGALGTLALIMIETGDLRGVEELLRDAETISGDLYGRSDFSSLRLRQLIGALLKTQGRMEEALAVNMELYETIVAEHGERAPISFSFGNNVAIALAGVGKSEEAETWYRRLITVADEALGTDNQWSLMMTSNLAELYCDDGRYQEAIPLARAAYESKLASHGEKHSGTLHPQILLGAALAATGRPDEGIRMLQAAHDMLQDDSRGPMSELGIQAATYFAEALTRDGQVERGRALAAETLRMAYSSIGSEHLLTQRLRALSAGEE